jgi:hypothetical protein
LTELPASEAFTISKRKGDPIAKRVEQIVFSAACLIANPKALHLVEQMVQ